MKMGDYVPTIQEKLRHEGYSDYQSETLRAFKISPPLDARPPEINSVEQRRWRFINLQKTEGYVLSENALVYHTTKYDSFEAFLGRMLKGAHLLDEIVQLNYIERIGLRYINAIYPKDQNDQIELYVNPSLLGFSQAIQGIGLIQNFSEATIIKENATIIARFITMDKSLPIPPDILPLQLVLEEKFNKNMEGKKAAILDFDHFANERMPIDFAKIENYLRRFHDGITEVFHHSTTEYAKQEWDKK
jgi:uncharacterized protein (TIGR04255 family)